MLRKLLTSFVPLFLLPVLLLSQGPGKISGKVTDASSGEPLIGANVVVEGTTLGSNTDIEGSFFVLNVPPGSYTIRTSYVGYSPKTITNVIVQSELTTTLEIKMSSTAVEVEAVVVVAERPLVNKDATNAIYSMRSEDIRNIPVRGYLDIIGLQPGAVKIGNTLYVRGGRSDEVAYFIDGMIVNNPFNSANEGFVVSEAIEEVTYQAGGFNAEYGFANSGLVSTTTKSGGRELSLSVGFITDAFLPQRAAPSITTSFANANLADVEKFISEGRQSPQSLMSYGYNNFNASLGGPIIGNDVRFHVAAEYVAEKDGDPSAGRNYYLPENKNTNLSVNSNVTFDFSPFSLRVGGFSGVLNDRVFSQYHSVFNASRNQDFDRNTHAYNAKLTQTIGTSTFWTAMASWFQTESEQADPIWKDNIESYGDPVKNPILAGPGRNPPNVYHNLFADSGYVNFGYSYNRSSYIMGKFDLSHQVEKTHLIKLGAEYRYNTIRYWSANTALFSIVKSTKAGLTREEYLRNSYTNNLGVAVDGVAEGRKTLLDDDSDVNTAPHPIIAAAYIQDKIELEDLVLNVGLRYDYINANVKRFKDPLDIIIESHPSGNYVLISDKNFEDGEASSTLSPRLGFSFPVTDRTVFHAQYGQFVQHPELNRLYTSTTFLAQQLTAGNYVNVGNPSLKPEKTITYEVGFSQQIGDNAGFDITAYYKDIQDLIQLQNTLAKPVQYARFVNGDYGTVKGLSVSFDLRRTERVSASANYTIQYASGTGSAATSNFNIAWLGGNFPTFVSPLGFDQRHTGSINLDFRTYPTDGPVLRGLGVNLLFTFGSGRPYTPAVPKGILFGPSWEQPTASLNSVYSPWNFQLDFKLDKTFSLGGANLNVYLWSLNLLNTKNVVTVYDFTGLPDDDGFFQTTDGVAYAGREGLSAIDGYRYRLGSPGNWGQPRQFRLGLRLDI